MDTVTDLFAGRNRIRDQLTTGQLHPLAALRNPTPHIATVPIGDLLCWCNGLDETAVSRILITAQVTWGRRISLLSAREQQRILWQVKQWRPEIWDRWKIQLAMKNAA